MPNFETTCIDWEDGKWDTEAPDILAAAESHALEGWMSDKEREPQCVIVLARQPGGPWSVVVVVGSEDLASAAHAPDYVVRGLEATGQLDDAKRMCRS